jgi:hypothetical protein
VTFNTPGDSAKNIFETGKRFYVSTCGSDLDVSLALDCFERAAAMGYPPAQRLLGVIYLEGDKHPKNYDLARKWLSLASGHGDPMADYLLAQIYAQGLGVAKDWSKAYRFLSRQGVSNIPEAMELKRRLKSELINLYPNLSTALENHEKTIRHSLTHRQHRFIPNFLDPVRTGDSSTEFETWLSLNLGRITAQDAFNRLTTNMLEYYERMTGLYPASSVEN